MHIKGRQASTPEENSEPYKDIWIKYESLCKHGELKASLNRNL